MSPRLITTALCLMAIVAHAKPAATRVKPVKTVLVTPGQGLGPGRVTDVTADSAFIDRGEQDGIAVGQSLKLTRGNRPAGTCEVQAVNAHRARCVGTALRVGDKLSINRVRPTPLAPLAPVPGAEAFRSLHQQVEAAAFQQLDFGQTLSPLGGDSHIHIALSHFSAIDPSAGRTAFHLERLDARVSELELGKGFSLSADGSLLFWASRPDAARDLRTTRVQLLLRQLSVTWRPDGLPIIASAGRIAPRHTPGLMGLDGAQVGWHNDANTVELGLYGGLLPNAVSLWPSTAWTAGAYGAFHSMARTGNETALLQLDTRAGWALRPNLGSRLEAGVSAAAFIGRSFDASAQVLLGALAQGAPVAIDSATLSLSSRPLDRLSVSAFGRYRGNPQLEFASIGAPLPTTRSLHASAVTSFEVTSQLSVSAQGGVGQEIATSLGQYWVGPEASLSGLLQGHLGFAAAYQEEFGTWRGRSGSLSANALLGSNVHVGARASYFQQTNLGADGLRELGVSATADARLMSWLSLRGSVLFRVPLTPATTSPGTGQGVVQLVADF